MAKYPLTPLLLMYYCCLGCTSDCLDKLTTGSGEKAVFNGYVLEPLVLLVEVIKFTQSFALRSLTTVCCNNYCSRCYMTKRIA